MSPPDLILEEGTPHNPGLYVVYTNDTIVTRWAARQLMTWSEGKWWYPSSSQSYRGHVYGWIGPLPAMPLEEA